jgi:flagellar biosynthesis/type III secretory pathway protein FliH
MAISQRLVRDAGVGEAVGVDGLGRYLSPDQRALLVGLLSDDVQVQADDIVVRAEARAAALIADAEARVEAVRSEASAAGFAQGYAEGHAASLLAMQPSVDLIQAASAEGQLLRGALLDGAEQQTVALALAVARRIVGAAADQYAGLAAEVVRGALRSAGTKVLRIQANAAEVGAIEAALIDLGRDVPVQSNAAVDVGGCIIDVENGRVDLRLDVQLASIERALTQPEV